MTRRAKVFRLALVAGVVVLAVAIVVAIVAARLGPAKIASNETAAVRALFSWMSAQKAYAREHGEFAESLRDLAGYGIPEGMGGAEAGRPKVTPYNGYLFLQTPALPGQGKLAVVAIPAHYGRTGRNMFYVDGRGCAYLRDANGVSVSALGREDTGRPSHELSESARTATEEDIRSLVSGSTAFAFDLYSVLAKTEAKNLFLSPHSLSIALATLRAAARGETAAQMDRVLRFGLPPEKLHPAFEALSRNIETAGNSGGCTLDSANGVWLLQEYPHKESFLQAIKRHYDAEFGTADFSTQRAREEAADRINNWVLSKTRGKLPSVIRAEEIHPAARLLMANAMYFAGEWESEFREHETKDLPFALVDGTQVEVPLMHQTELFRYAEDQATHVLFMNYKDSDLAMIVALPKEGEGLEQVEALLSPGTLEGWRDDSRVAEVEVYFPRFKLDRSLELRETLESIGMTDAFDVARADLSALSDEKPLWVDWVKQRALIEVDEEGTRAAAFSGWIPVGGGGNDEEPEPIIFRADHPFLFFISDRKTKTILFMGRVMDPRSPGDPDGTPGR